MGCKQILELENALLDFIKRELKEATSENSLAVVPEAARILVELIRDYGYLDKSSATE